MNERARSQRASKAIRDVEDEIYRLELEKTPLKLFKLKRQKKEKPMKSKNTNSTITKLEQIKTGIIVAFTVGILAFLAGMHYESTKAVQVKQQASELVNMMKAEQTTSKVEVKQ